MNLFPTFVGFFWGVDLRLNIEGSVFSDPRFFDLILKCKNQYEALGILVLCWKKAQATFLEFGKIPSEKWNEKFQILVDVGFVEKHKDGYYVRGSEKHFSWLIQKSNAGKLSAAKKSENKNPTKINGDQRKSTGVDPSKKTEQHEMIRLWNSESALPKVLKTNQARQAKIQKIYSKLTPEEWASVFRKISESDFCCGKNNTGWKATFDWVLQPQTYLKVLEGKYDSGKKKKFENERDIDSFSKAISESKNQE